MNTDQIVKNVLAAAGRPTYHNVGYDEILGLDPAKVAEIVGQADTMPKAYRAVDKHLAPRIAERLAAGDLPLTGEAARPTTPEQDEAIAAWAVRTKAAIEKAAAKVVAEAAPATVEAEVEAPAPAKPAPAKAPAKARAPRARRGAKVAASV